MNRRFSAAGLGIPAIIAGILATGCSTFSETGPKSAASCKAPDGVGLVVGVHADSPEPSLDDLNPSLQCKISEAIRAERPVRLVVAGGHPQVITPKIKTVSGGTLAEKRSSWVQGNVQKINAEIGTARPEGPGIDALEALGVAADALRGAGVQHPELILQDAGLNDSGVLNFGIPGMLAANPSEIAAALRASGDLPKKLRGAKVILVGLGYTSPPQQPLIARWRSNLTAIWEEVLRAAGAQVQSIPRPAQGPAVRTPHAVKTVPVPEVQAVKPSPGKTLIFRENSPVRFRPNSLGLADRAAAMRALEPTAEWLAADSSRQALLVGTTARVGALDRQKRFGGQRADRVAGMLIELGVSAEQLRTKGVGSAFSEYIPDHDAAGSLLPAPAALNRSVRVSLSHS